MVSGSSTVETGAVPSVTNWQPQMAVQQTATVPRIATIVTTLIQLA
jgi:hypothetical protein